LPQLVVQVRSSPFHREVARFRRSRGYTTALFGSPEAACASPPRSPPPPKADRIAEVCALLAAPDRPRPSNSFGAYHLVFQLFMAVDNRYFGAYHPQSARGERREIFGLQDTIAADPASGWNIGVFDGLAVLIGARGAIELWQSGGERCLFRDVRRPGEAAAVREAGQYDYFAELRRYALERSAAADWPAGPETKSQRVERLFSLLEHAPRPGNRLEAHIAVNQLLCHLEEAAFGAWGNAVDSRQRLTGVMPFSIRVSDAFPGAEMLFSSRHALLFYADGTADIYPYDGAVPTSGEGLVRLGERPVATLKGRSNIEAPAELLS
jgi:hypothetical protein